MRSPSALLIVLVGAVALAISLPIVATPDCSDARVRRMAQRGDTITSIANKCELDEEEVEEILDTEPDPTPRHQGPVTQPTHDLLPSGAAVGQCGCWGFVDPDYWQRHPQCQSGVAVARVCGTACPTGGYSWQGVCR